MFNWIKLVERNMRRNLRRTILTILTIALATFIYTVLVSVPASRDRVLKDASGTLRLITVNKTAPWEDLPARYCDDIRQMPGVAACTAITGWPATWRDVSDPVFAVGAGPEIADVYPDYALTGQQREAAAKDRRAAVVGEILMRKYGWKIGDTLTLRSANSDHMEMTFVIVGQMASKHYPNIFLIRRDYLMAARKAHGLADQDIAWDIITRATSADAMATLAKEIDEHYTNSDAETRSMTESDALSSGLSAIGNIRTIVFALCLVVLLTVLLIAANSTVMMVREQISDVA
ncbi:MAG TPA: ABC transporter permease, partial [Candidatus Binatus sp.]|nr:ABC transporter permease [Candidatus Binatus sp.]